MKIILWILWLVAWVACFSFMENQIGIKNLQAYAVVGAGLGGLLTHIFKFKGGPMEDAYEDAEKRDTACGKALLTCPECQSNLISVKRPGGIKWMCSDAIHCFYSFFEATE